MKRTAESIINEMEATGIMVEPRMTAAARLDGLCAYQEMALQKIFNAQHATNLRFKDGIQHIKHLAREKGLTDSQVVRQAIADMEYLSKEIAIAISGQKGENAVAKSVRYANRRCTAIPNVILSEGNDESELDQVLVTSNGILILEVKNNKKDVTISETGCICNGSSKYMFDKCLGEQMNRNRYLLRSALEKALQDAGWSIPVHIDSFVVFSSSSVRVTDEYQQEKYCFNASLPHEIDNYSSDVTYTDEQMETLAAMIRNIAEADKLYPVDLDFDRIRKTFAEALVLLEADPVEQAEEDPATEAVQDDFDLGEDEDDDDSQGHSRSALGWIVLAGAAAIAAGVLAHRKFGVL